MTSAQVIIWTEKNPDADISLNYDDDDSSQGCGQIREAFGALTKDDILRPYISDHDFGTSINGNDIGCNLYDFHIRDQKNLESAQPKKVEINLSENIPAGIHGYALVLTNKLVSKSSDGQRHFDLI